MFLSRPDPETNSKLQAVREPKPGNNRGAPTPAVNKAGLISALKEKNSFFNRKADSERALNLMGEVLFQNLAQGKDVIWSDLGLQRPFHTFHIIPTQPS